MPYFESITPKQTESKILELSGVDGASQQSVLIQWGNQIEKWWNHVISDLPHVTNYAEIYGNMIVVKDKNRQTDHLFRIRSALEVVYLESKSYLGFDSEKTVASNNKVQEVTEAVENKYNLPVTSGYFTPCEMVPNIKDVNKYGKLGIGVYGPKWLIEKLECDLFTVEELESALRNEVAEITRRKLGR